MEDRTQHSVSSVRPKGLLFGLLLILTGILFLSFNFGWLDPALKSVVFSWPVIFIVCSLIALVKREYWGLLFWLVIGLFFLLPKIAAAYPGLLPGIDSDFARNYWPVLLILGGICFILKVVAGNKKRSFCKKNIVSSYPENSDGTVKFDITFGGSESIFLEPVFRGGDIDLVFAGVVLDLRKTHLPEGETCLNIDAVFSGITLYIPEDWFVVTRFNAMLGGVNDKRIAVHSAVDKTRKLILQGDLVFGGCEIR